MATFATVLESAISCLELCVLLTVPGKPVGLMAVGGTVGPVGLLTPVFLEAVCVLLNAVGSNVEPMGVVEVVEPALVPTPALLVVFVLVLPLVQANCAGMMDVVEVVEPVGEVPFANLSLALALLLALPVALEKSVGTMAVEEAVALALEIISAT